MNGLRRLLIVPAAAACLQSLASLAATPAQTGFAAFERKMTGHLYAREQAHDPKDAIFPAPATASFVLAAYGQYRAHNQLLYPGKIEFRDITVGSLDGTKTIDEMKWRDGIAIQAGDAAAARAELADYLFLSPQLIAQSAESDLAGRPVRMERDATGRISALYVADRTYLYSDYRCIDGACQPYAIAMRRGQNLAAQWTVTHFRLNPEINDDVFTLPDGYVAAKPHGPLRLSQLADNVFRIDGAASGYHGGVIKGERGIAVFDPSVSVEEAGRNRKLIESRFPGIPITHIILSHAHGDHIRGLPAYLGEGVTVVAGDRAALPLKRMFGDAVRVMQETRQPYRIDLGGVAVQVIPVRSTHAATMVMAHVGNVLFEGDLFYIPEQGQVPPAFEGAGELWNAIKSHGLPVDQIVGVHGRTGTLAELQEALEKPRPH